MIDSIWQELMDGQVERRIPNEKRMVRIPMGRVQRGGSPGLMHGLCDICCHLFIACKASPPKLQPNLRRHGRILATGDTDGHDVRMRLICAVCMTA